MATKKEPQKEEETTVKQEEIALVFACYVDLYAPGQPLKKGDYSEEVIADLIKKGQLKRA